MSALNDMLLWLSKNRVPFYIEHNDYLNSDLDPDEEVAWLLAEGHISSHEANTIMLDKCVWYVRLHIRPCYPETAYGDTLHRAVEKLYNKIKDK